MTGETEQALCLAADHLDGTICNAHGESERLQPGDFKKGIRSTVLLYQEFAQL